MAGRTVTFHYELRREDGTRVDTSRGKSPEVWHEGITPLMKGAARMLRWVQPGQRATVALGPEEGFGRRDERAVHAVNRAQFDPSIEITAGVQIGAQSPHGGDPVPAWIVAAEGDTVTVDFNHPLAGQKLWLDVEVLEVR